MEIDPDNGRNDVFDTASPRNTVNTKGFEASTPALLVPPQNTREAKRSELQSPRNTANTDAVGLCAARVNSTSVPLTMPSYLRSAQALEPDVTS